MLVLELLVFLSFLITVPAVVLIASVIVTVISPKYKKTVGLALMITGIIEILPFIISIAIFTVSWGTLTLLLILTVLGFISLFAGLIYYLTKKPAPVINEQIQK